MNYLNESLAHETDNNELTKDIKFKCSKCGIISTEFENIECDENIWGLCPNCKEYCIIYNLSKEV